MSITKPTELTYTSPDRSLQEAQPYSANATAFARELKVFGNELRPIADEINSALDTISNASDVSDAALAGANYQGLWSSLTGAASKPFSVKHNGKFWALNTDLADITAKEPSVDIEWDELFVSLRGVETLTPSVAAELSSSTLISLVAPTVGGLGMTMPASSSYDDGSLAKIIKNNGRYSFFVTTKDGARVLAEVKPQHTCYLYQMTSVDADGTWIAQTVDPKINRNIPELLNASSSSSFEGVAIGDNKYLVVYEDAGNSNYFYGVCITEADGALTIGTPVELAAVVVGGGTAVSATDADDEAVAAFVTSAGAINFLYLTVSGTVITVADTEAGVVSSSVSTSTDIALQWISTDKYFLATGYTTGHGYSLIINTSGTAYSSKGSLAQLNGSNGGSDHQLIYISSNKVAISFKESSTVPRIMLCTVSGDVVTNGSPLGISQGSSTARPDICFVSEDVLVCLSSYNATGYNYLKLASYTISGTALTLTDTTIFCKSPENVIIKGRAIPLGSGLVCAYGGNNAEAGEYALYLFSVDDEGGIERIASDEFAYPSGSIDPRVALSDNALFKMRDGLAMHIHTLTGNYAAASLITADLTL